MSKEQSSEGARRGRPTISHFAQSQAKSLQSQSALNTGSQKEDQVKSASLRKKLQELYPTPKTTEQVSQDVLERQEIYAKRRPKHPILMSALFASIIFYVALLLFRNLEILWFSGGIVGISFSFGVMIGLLVAIYFCITYIRDIFYIYDGSITLFTTAYSAVGFLLFGGTLAGWLGSIGGSMQLLLVAVIHFLMMSFALRLSLKKGV